MNKDQVWMTFKPDQSFTMSFRWLLKSTNHPEIRWWATKIKTDYVNKIVDLDIFDDKDGNVFNWIQSILKSGKEEAVQLNHLNNSGETISLLNFKNLEIIEHFTTYDYKLSNPLTHSLKIKFQTIERS